MAGDFIHGRHTGGRAAGTIDDFIHGCQGALWSDCILCYKDLLNRLGNVEAGGTGVLKKWQR
jgi:hypothetical protein